MNLELNKSNTESIREIVILKELPQEETNLETDWMFVIKCSNATLALPQYRY